MRITAVNVLVEDQDEALRFYTETLGFELVEDFDLGGYRWLTVRAPGDSVTLSLTQADTEAERRLVGRQGGGKPLLGITTEDCMGDYERLRARGAIFEGAPQAQPYGTGVLLRDLHGDGIFLNEEPETEPD
jgi:catechol 2,3-dioxygenase-like lactoylglutathione lyase family enzyme